MNKIKELINSIPCPNTKFYRPTIFRISALALSAILGITTFSTFNYLKPSFQTQSPIKIKSQTFEEKLKEDTYRLASIVEARVLVIKQLRANQRSPIYMLSQINKRMSSYPAINLDSITDNNNLITLTGSTSKIEQLVKLTKDIEFSGGLFTRVSFELMSVSENGANFQIKCTYNPPIAVVSNNTNSETQTAQDSNNDQVQVKTPVQNIPTPKIVISEEVKLKHWMKRNGQAQLETRSLRYLLPEDLESSLVFQNLVELSSQNNLDLTQFSLNELLKRDTYKEQFSTVSVRGNYNDVGKFLEGLNYSRRIVNTQNINIKKLANPSKEQTVEATFTLSMFFATQSDISPLMTLSKTDFYVTMDKIIGYSEQNPEEEASNSEDQPQEEDQSPPQEEDDLFPGYVKVKTDPFGSK